MRRGGLSAFKGLGRVLRRATRTTIVVWAVAASLVASQVSVAALAPMPPVSSAPAAHHPPCHPVAGVTDLADASSDQGDGPAAPGPCPMMHGAICIALCAASVPAPGAALVALSHHAAPLAWFEPAGFVGSVISPPQRPPKSL